MNKSETIAKLAEALAKFQAEIRNPSNTVVNTYWKNKYAPLSEVFNTIRPILGKYGLSFIQNQITEQEGKLGILTLLMHSSGEYIETDPIFATLEKNTPQGVGSASTYLRRYSISSTLGISSEDDDDGNENEKPPKIDDKKANKTNNTQPQVKPEDRLAQAIKSIEELTTSLQNAGVDKKLIADAIMQHNKTTDKTTGESKGIANYNKIKDIEVATNVYKELKTLEVK